jgi:hydroxymethylbilane synthase
MTVRIGSRRTPLALAQTRLVVDALLARDLELDVEIVEIVSDGDRDRTLPLGPGVFVAALREALLEGRVDAAVHSLKDLPTGSVDGIVLAAVPQREDPRDALVASQDRVLDELPSGARIGTSSPRRAAAMLALQVGLEPTPIRGSVGKRLEQLDAGDVDAIVLARAGLVRLDLADRITDVIDPGRMLPAPGQGALAVECRADDAATHELLAHLDDAPTRAAVHAERTLLAVLEAGCSAPVGALAEPAEGDDGEIELYLRAVVHATDGSSQVRLSATGPLNDAEGLGRRLAADLLAAGADSLLESTT